jgi:hypothetical protein
MITYKKHLNRKDFKLKGFESYCWASFIENQVKSLNSEEIGVPEADKIPPKIQIKVISNVLLDNYALLYCDMLNLIFLLSIGRNYYLTYRYLKELSSIAFKICFASRLYSERHEYLLTYGNTIETNIKFLKKKIIEFAIYRFYSETFSSIGEIIFGCFPEDKNDKVLKKIDDISMKIEKKTGVNIRKLFVWGVIGIVVIKKLPALISFVSYGTDTSVAIEPERKQDSRPYSVWPTMEQEGEKGVLVTDEGKLYDLSILEPSFWNKEFTRRAILEGKTNKESETWSLDYLFDLLGFELRTRIIIRRISWGIFVVSYYAAKAMSEATCESRMGVIQYRDAVTDNDRKAYGYDRMISSTPQTGYVHPTGHALTPGVRTSNSDQSVRVYDSYVVNDSIQFKGFDEGDIVVVRQHDPAFTIHFDNSLTA